MRELASPRNEASINKQPADTNITPIQQQAVDAWREIGNLPKNQQAQKNSQNDGSLTFDLIYRDSDSVTHCRGYSSPDVDKISCITKDLAEKNDKPFPDKKDKSLRDRLEELNPLESLRERLPERPNIQLPNGRQNSELSVPKINRNTQSPDGSGRDRFDNQFTR